MILSLAMIGGVRFFIRACNELGTWAVIEGEAGHPDPGPPVRGRADRGAHGSIGDA